MRHRIRERAVVIVGAVLLVSGVALALLGAGIWVLGLAVWVISTALFAVSTPWSFAAVAGLVTPLALETLLLRATPLTGLDLSTSHAIAWGVLGVAALVALWWSRPRFSWPDRRRAVVSASVVLVPLLGAIVAFGSLIVTGGRRIAWAMSNDAVWTTMVARHIAHDGGVDTPLHPNSSPLTSALMALASSPGRSALRSSQLLGHDVVSGAVFWIVISLVSSLVAGLIVAGRMPVERPVLRVIAVVIVGAIPLSWFSSGIAIHFGFYSASLAMLCLLCAAALWLGAAQSPVQTLVALLALSTAMLATWAPLVVVPLALSLALVIVRFRRIVVLRWAVIVPLALAIVQFLGYALLVALPDLRRDGGALAALGAAPTISPMSVLVIGGLVALLGVLATARRGAPFESAGVVGILAGLAAGLGLLLFQSVSAGTGWSYYPDKFAWLAETLLVVLATALAASLLARLDLRRSQLLAASAALLVLVGGVMLQADPRPHSVAALTGIDSIARPDPQKDALAARLFALSGTPRTLLSHYSGNPADDAFVNAWFFQETAQRSADPIRAFAYVFDSTNPASVCQAIQTWGGTVHVLTTSAAWADELRHDCTADFTVRVSAPVL